MNAEKINDKTAETDGGNRPKSGDMCGFSTFESENTAKTVSLESVADCLTGAQRERLVSGYDLKKFAKIFEDESLMNAVNTFLESGMNISKAARMLYMHRNTLIYRLNTLRKRTGLDLRNFEMAVTFKLLHALYLIK